MVFYNPPRGWVSNHLMAHLPPCRNPLAFKGRSTADLPTFFDKNLVPGNRRLALSLETSQEGHTLAKPFRQVPARSRIETAALKSSSETRDRRQGLQRALDTNTSVCIWPSRVVMRLELIPPRGGVWEKGRMLPVKIFWHGDIGVWGSE